MPAIILAVLAQGIDAIDIKIGVIQPIGLIAEVLTHAFVASEHRFDNTLAGVVELLVLELDQNDGDASLSHGRNGCVGITAAHLERVAARHFPLFGLHGQAAALGLDKRGLTGSAIVCVVGEYSGQSCYRLLVVETAVGAAFYHQAILGEERTGKRITHRLDCQCGAVILGHFVPTWFGWHRVCR